MDIAKNYYVNRNTGNLTTNLNNTIVKDEDKVPFKKKYCALGITEVEPEESRIAAFGADLPYRGKTQYYADSNSIDYGKGANIMLDNGWSIELALSGWKVNQGDLYDTETARYAQELADNMTRLLKYAEYQIKYPTDTNAKLKEWSDSIIEGLSRSGIDTSKTFTVNGMEFTVEDGIVKSTEKIRQDKAAKEAYEMLQIKNKTYNECNTDTRNNIDYLYDYYCADIPDEIKKMWYETMEECNVNPFANNSGAIARMSLDKDKATGWDKDLFGSTADSVKEGLENLIEYLELHSTMDQEYDSKQMSFFESLLNKISLLNL